MPPSTTALPARPDTTVQDGVPTADGGSWAQAAWDLITGIPDGAWYALAAVIIALGLISSIRIATRKRRNPRSLKTDKFMTFLAAGVSTGVVATGMWKFFGDVLHIDNPIARVALFAVFEIAMLASAFRSRRFRLDRAAKRETDPEHVDKRIDVDGIAVWCLALISGLFAAADETTTTAKAVRVVVPLLAAWMWERGLAGELMQFTRGAKRLNLRITPERILVWLGVAEPASRGIDEVARRRRIARFARTAFRLHLLIEKPGDGNTVRNLRVGWLRWRLRRQTESGNEHLNLAGDQAALHDVRLQIALLYGAEEGTSRDAVRELTPLTPVKRVAIAAEAHTPTPPEVPPVGGPEDATGTANLSARIQGDTHAMSAANSPANLSAKQADSTPANETATGYANRVATETPPAPPRARQPRASRVANTDASGSAPEAARKLAKWVAKYPDATNADLAKRAKCSERTVSRYRATAEAINLANSTPEDDKERPHVASLTLPVPDPRTSVLSGTNGHTYPTEEN